MLKLLSLKGVGPAEKFGPVEFAPRLNFITGDNGLGKSFLLDAAWWALTRTWARGSEAIPRESSSSASIEFAFSKVTAGTKPVRFSSRTVYGASRRLVHLPASLFMRESMVVFLLGIPRVTIGLINRRELKRKSGPLTFLLMRYGKALCPKRAPISAMA